MFCRLVFGLSLVFAIAASAAIDNSSVARTKAEVIFIDNVAKLNDLYPGVELTAIKGVNAKGNVAYTLGARQSGDSLVASGSEYKSWSTPSDVTLSLSYQVVGDGSYVTYFQVLLSQSSSDLANVYIASGGIGQQTLTVIIEAKNTNYLGYDYEFYGY